MKVAILIFVTCLIWNCQSSPVQLVENHALATQAKAIKSTGRQSGVVDNAVASNTSDDDDDDDDDEDDIEDALVGDDDDDDDDDPAPVGQAAQAIPAASSDDDDDDDDEEDDYIERIFDDILDEDDDDDDDDAVPSVPASPQPAAPATQPAAAVAEPAGQSVATNDVDVAGVNVDYPNEADQTVFYDEENGAIDTKVDIQSLNKPQETAPVATGGSQKISANNVQQQNVNDVSDNSEDDDDDDDDDIEGALEDEDDDDDDDDDVIGIDGDVIEAKRARSLVRDNMVPEIMTSRYNRFVDGIFSRINKILKKSYDPVVVQLALNGEQEKSKRLHHGKRKSSKKNQRQAKPKESSSQPIENKADEPEMIQPLPDSTVDPNEKTYVLIPQPGQGQRSNQEIPVGIPEKFITSISSNVNPEERTTSLRSGQKRSPSGTTSGSRRKSSKSKGKQNGSSPRRSKAQGTLYGLASLKRIGNVKVTPNGSNSTVKSKFSLGPLTLKVEKSFKRGSVRDVKSATASTNEMIGRINLKVVNGAATLVSIKVQQPKQVQVDSDDNHDRTREFVWERSSHIAHLVSEKLRAAAESLLQPIGSQITHLK